MDYDEFQEESGIVQPKQRGIYSEMINPQVAQENLEEAAHENIRGPKSDLVIKINKT